MSVHSFALWFKEEPIC